MERAPSSKTPPDPAERLSIKVSERYCFSRCNVLICNSAVLRLLSREFVNAPSILFNAAFESRVDLFGVFVIEFDGPSVFPQRVVSFELPPVLLVLDPGGAVSGDLRLQLPDVVPFPAGEKMDDFRFIQLGVNFEVKARARGTGHILSR